MMHERNVLRFVHTQLIDYEASKDDQFNDLYTMVDGVGPFKDVKKLRNEKRADIVGLIIAIVIPSKKMLSRICLSASSGPLARSRHPKASY
jgi:hypothetical protein